jgi:hypothetical protein
MLPRLLPSDRLKIFAALHALDAREAVPSVPCSIISGVTSMRRVADFADKVTAGIATSGFERRAVRPTSPGRTALVLVRHGQTEKAILVSETGIYADAVWIPKLMVTLEQPSERGVLVASLSIDFARQKGLSVYGRHIDPTLFNEATREVLAEAVARAARKRNEYRKHRQGHARFDTQHQFC